MKNVIILGASGNIARQVTDMLLQKNDVKLTLFVRSANRLKNSDATNPHVIEGDVLNYDQLAKAIKGHDIVYMNLAGALEEMAKNVVKAMKETGARRVILISSIGIYEKPLKSVLLPYRKSADVIESSGLEYTILRPAWFTSVNEIDYETTRKGELEKGSVISMKSLATLISKIIEFPEQFAGENLGVNKPKS